MSGLSHAWIRQTHSFQSNELIPQGSPCSVHIHFIKPVFNLPTALCWSSRFHDVRALVLESTFANVGLAIGACYSAMGADFYADLIAAWYLEILRVLQRIRFCLPWVQIWASFPTLDSFVSLSCLSVSFVLCESCVDKGNGSNWALLACFASVSHTWKGPLMCAHAGSHPAFLEPQQVWCGVEAKQNEERNGRDMTDSLQTHYSSTKEAMHDEHPVT